MLNPSVLNEIVPPSNKARKTEGKIKTSCSSPEAAGKLYEFLKISLTDVNNWGSFEPGFRLYTKLVGRAGQALDRAGRSGDCVRIPVRGWQSKVAVQYELWEITRVEERRSGSLEIFYITLAPAVNPDQALLKGRDVLKRGSGITLFVIRDERRLELEVYVRDAEFSFLFSGFKVGVRHIVMDLLMIRKFRESCWVKLMKAVFKSGMSQVKCIA
jgi:hypothetical protein